MSKGLASYSSEQIAKIAERRIINGTRGIGYWGAINYFDKKHMKYPGKAGLMQNIKEAHDNAIFDDKGYSRNGSSPVKRHQGNLRGTDPEAGGPKRGNNSLRDKARARNTNRMALSALRHNTSPLDGRRNPHAKPKTGTTLGAFWPRSRP